jgi:hypothetical protein
VAGDAIADGALIGIEAYGVRLDLRLGDASLVPAVMPLLPPGWREAEGPADIELALAREGASRFIVNLGAEAVSQPVELDIALDLLEERIRSMVAAQAPEHIFIHAGVVGHRRGAIMLPGDSFAGKTTLVAALVRAGAAYYSDEFAVVDREGMVHPYPKLLSVRGARGEQATDVSAGSLGGTTANSPLPVALVALTSYERGARWDPRPEPPGQLALTLLSHTIPARDRPADALRVARRIAQDAPGVRGARGDAEPVARALLGMLDG